jgi:hypothetical protein
MRAPLAHLHDFLRMAITPFVDGHWILPAITLQSIRYSHKYRTLRAFVPCTGQDAAHASMPLLARGPSLFHQKTFFGGSPHRLPARTRVALLICAGMGCLRVYGHYILRVPVLLPPKAEPG